MITRLLVANRAEIASRLFRTCRKLGIATVAVHSDADAGLPYVREADAAVRLPGNSPAETYLDIAAVLAAAKASGADAIHPGYGFLAENADFARAVIGAGLTWVGPSPESIEAMGSKTGAKALMREAGVPVLEAPAQPTEADLPLIVKASAGGGGRGMRVVRRLEDLPGEIAAAEAEAASAFGDGTVFVEPYVENGRHVEVQVVGTSIYGERDCSLQRRHQKVVEEAPAPGLGAEVRAALHDAARRAAEAVDYRGAGTVEFLYDPATERFWFLEMNTRLQVEHPVTELVHGVDLVELQVCSAEDTGGFETGAERPPQPPAGAEDPQPPEGAERPPQPPAGAERPQPPEGAERPPQPPAGAERPPQPPAGAERPPQPPEGAERPPQPPEGAERPPQPPAGAERPPQPPEGAEDPQPPEGAERPQPPEGAERPQPPEGAERPPQPSASVVEEVAQQPSRNPDGHAIEARLYAENPAEDHQPQSGTLTLFEIPVEDGIRVDAGFETGSEVSTYYDAMLAKVIAHAPTRTAAARKLAGVLSRARIHGVQTNRDQLLAVLRDERFLSGQVSTGLLALVEPVETSAGQAPAAAALALAEAAKQARTVQQGIPVAWRNVVSQPQVTEFEDGTTVRWWGGRDGYVLEDAAVVSTRSTAVVLEQDGVRTPYAVAITGDTVDVDWPGGHATYRRKPKFVDPADAVASGSLLAPMPGTVVSVSVEPGQQVEAGQPVLVLEAMKMQHTVRAPDAGTVTEIDVQVGDQVAAAAVLAVVSTSSTSSTSEE